MNSIALNNSDLNQCEKHQQEIVQFKLEVAGDIKSKLLCSQCFREQPIQNSILWTEAQNQVEDQKQSRFSNFKQVLKTIRTNIEELQKTIKDFKQKIIGCLEELEKVTINWKQEIDLLQEKGSPYSYTEELEILIKKHNKIQFQDNLRYDELKECNSKNYATLKNQCKNFLLQQDIYKLLKTVDSIQSSVEKDYTQTDQEEQIEQNKIPCICQQHNLPITIIRLDKDVAKEQRTLCNSCNTSNKILEMNFQSEWKKYQDEIQLNIQKKKENFESETGKIKQKLRDLNQHLEENTQEITIQLDENLNVIKKINLQKKRITQDLSLEDLQTYAEEYSQLKKIDINLENKDIIKFDQEIEKYRKLMNQQFLQFNNKLIQKMKELIYNQITYQQTHQVEQKQWCGAIAFNYSGTIMAAGFKFSIKLWKLQNSQLQPITEIQEQHEQQISCLAFSKKQNFLVSGSYDKKIKCWKEENETKWTCIQTLNEHIDVIQCIILNSNDSQLFSCSKDKSIKVWNIEPQKNQLSLAHSLEKHTDCVYSICLNEKETLLVSCGRDAQIIVWGIGRDRKWEFKYIIMKAVNDYGKRVCFIDQDIIVWQQYSKGITHIFMLQNDKFTERQDLNLQLGNEKEDNCFFPSIYNKQCQILIQKYNKYVYIINRVSKNKFKIEKPPINCDSDQNMGGLTPDGSHLVIWNEGSCQFRVYKINKE